MKGKDTPELAGRGSPTMEECDEVFPGLEYEPEPEITKRETCVKCRYELI